MTRGCLYQLSVERALDMKGEVWRTYIGGQSGVQKNGCGSSNHSTQRSTQGTRGGVDGISNSKVSARVILITRERERDRWIAPSTHTD